jgi:hypothetical protein
MPVSESARYRLFEAARTQFGQEPAETLMDLLPPVGWADVATKADVQHLGDTLRAEFRAGFAELQGDLRRELHESHGSLRTELHESHGSLRTELHESHRSLSRQIHDQTRTLVFMIIGSNATLVALAFAAARIAGG